MYEVALKGNYNIKIDDLGVEFNESHRVRVFTDDEYEGSSDLKFYVGRYLVARKVDGAEVVTTNGPATGSQIDIVEVASTPVEERPVIVADGASKRASQVDEKKAAANKVAAERIHEMANNEAEAKLKKVEQKTVAKVAESKATEVDSKVVETKITETKTASAEKVANAKEANGNDQQGSDATKQGSAAKANNKKK